MMGLEPQVLSHLSKVAKSTTEIIKEMYGEECNLDRARTPVHKALVALEEDGTIESRMLNTPKPTRYWALPGGAFPEGAECPLTQRILIALKDGPMVTDSLAKAVYSHAETVDSVNAEKRLGKALKRLRDKGKVEKCLGSNGKWRPTTWRLVE